MRSVDLNADLGEIEGHEEVDERILRFVTSVSVACGFHAGDPARMRRIARSAAALGVALGAHPSYSDKEGFGRRDVDVAADTLASELAYQLGALVGIAKLEGSTVGYVKPHGALYHAIERDQTKAEALVEAVACFPGTRLLVRAGAPIGPIACKHQVVLAREAFCDRAYLSDGRIAARGDPGALMLDPELASRQALSIVLENRVTTMDGEAIPLEADSICIHGDTPGAVAIAARVRESLDAAGVVLRSFCAKERGT